MEIPGQKPASEHLKQAWEGTAGFVKQNLGAIFLGTLGAMALGVDPIPAYMELKGPYWDNGEPVFNPPTP